MLPSLHSNGPRLTCGGVQPLINTKTSIVNIESGGFIRNRSAPNRLSNCKNVVLIGWGIKVKKEPGINLMVYVRA